VGGLKNTSGGVNNSFPILATRTQSPVPLLISSAHPSGSSFITN